MYPLAVPCASSAAAQPLLVNSTPHQPGNFVCCFLFGFQRSKWIGNLPYGGCPTVDWVLPGRLVSFQ